MRYALSDRQWRLIKDHFPVNGRRGNQWKDHRTIVNGILWILRTGAPWRDLPDQFGSWKTVYDRFRRWAQNGFWDELLSHLQALKNRKGKIDWRLFCIDGSVVRAHKASAGASKKVTKLNPKITRQAGAEAGSLQKFILFVMVKVCPQQLISVRGKLMSQPIVSTLLIIQKQHRQSGDRERGRSSWQAIRDIHPVRFAKNSKLVGSIPSYQQEITSLGTPNLIKQSIENETQQNGVSDG